MRIHGASRVSGADTIPKVVRAGGLAVSADTPGYSEMVKTGRVFSGGTAVTGVAPGTAIGTTAAFSLYTPVGSGYNLIILTAKLSYLSGTLGIGVVDWVANTNVAAAATTGTAITAVNNLVGSSTAAVGRPLTTATLPAAPTLFDRFCNLPPILATSVVTPWVFAEVVDGRIIVIPGATMSLEGTAGAGTSPLVLYGISWFEELV